MSTTTILFLQSMLIFLQMANAGLANLVHSPVASMLIGAGVGAFQYFVQHVGNQTVPPPPAQNRPNI